MSRKLTTEERNALKETLKDAEGEEVMLAKIAEMSDSDRAMAERVHAIVMKAAPGLAPRTWYGMPAYAKDGKVLLGVKNSGKFGQRYTTLEFQDVAQLDSGLIWPTSYAVVELTKTGEQEIAALIRKALG